MPQIDDVNTEKAEQDQGLPPLRRVPPKNPGIFDGQCLYIRSHAYEWLCESLHQTLRISKKNVAIAPLAEPFPLTESALATLNHGKSFVEWLACLRKT